MATAYVALGSNLGDRRSHLDHALGRLATIGTVVNGSPIYETEPVGGPMGQGPYLNAVVGIDSALAPGALLGALLGIESERGRVRTERWGPRTLDLDLLWYRGERIDEPGLRVPHPEIRSRPFVLAPLADVAPSVGDDDGPFASSLSPGGAPGLVRVTGPLHPDGTRWLVGLADAVSLDPSGPGRFSTIAHPDWANTSGDAFGGYLAAVALEAVKGTVPGRVPSHLTYRYLRGVPAGAELTIEVALDRSSARTSDCTVIVAVDGVEAGACTVGVVAALASTPSGPPLPAVRHLSECVPVPLLIEATGRVLGTSAHSWKPLERWDVPDLVDGSEHVVRAWCPNVVYGSDDPYLHAASIVMPIDALIWPATMQRLGLLPNGPPIATPTIELVARFADLSNEAWFVAEASIDHLTDKTTAGTVRVWGADGRYAAIGHSLNLVRR